MPFWKLVTLTVAGTLLTISALSWGGYLLWGLV